MKIAFETIVNYFKGKSRLTLAAIAILLMGEWSRRHNSWTPLDKDMMGKSYGMKGRGAIHNENDDTKNHSAPNNSHIDGAGGDAQQDHYQEFQNPAPGLPSSYFSEGSCWRTCPDGSRQNHIVVSSMEKTDLDHHSHLTDRAWELRAIANLAGYLCATLHAPSPSLWMKSLMERHHNSSYMEDSDALGTASWYDLYNLTYLADGEPSMLEFDSWDQVPQLDQDSRHSVVHTTRGEVVVRDFEYVEALSFPATWDKKVKHTFVWDLDISWWNAQHHLQRLMQHRKQSDKMTWIK